MASIIYPPGGPEKLADQGAGRPEIHGNKLLASPFAGWTHDRMTRAIDDFVELSGLEDYDKYIRRGAFLAQSKTAFREGRPRQDDLTLTEEERAALQLENSRRRIDKFKQPWMMYALIGCCSLGAAVQGWDETAVNGAQLYYREAFFGADSQNDGRLGLVNSAPYLCCVIACWLNYPLNRLLNRRGVIFITCLISSITCLGQAFPQTWQQLFVARFLLGLGIGPKSATIPIYAAESAPANIRGALVMMWQMWTAFGIMCGYISGVVLAPVGDGTDGNLCNHERGNLLSFQCSLNWRLMLASPMILPLVVVAYVYTLPESPRWLLMKARAGNKKKYEEAYTALCKLRFTKIQAGRDLFLINHLLKEEEDIMEQQHPFKELFTYGRNRRALIASVITMFLQQFCGVNISAYYSTTFLHDNAHYSETQSLLLSMGFGIINFVFALPAVWTIDTFGRRSLLLATFPWMSLFQLIMAIAFTLRQSTTKNILVILGMYLFGVAYSPGEGPVPFVYSAESLPLYNRDFGMGIVTSVNWFWNFFIAVTWPKFVSAFTAAGAFGWYAAWCFIGWWMILFFVPETKDLTLEQLDQVFDFPTKDHVKHGRDQLTWFIGTYILRRKRLKRPVLLHKEDEEFLETQGVYFETRDPTYQEVHLENI